MDEKNGLLPGFGKRLKDRRNELKMTQRALAEKSGIAFRSIQDYESEKRTPKIDARIAIAKALAVPYECLFVPSALSTNLAEVGTDCISRQAAIDALEDAEDAFGYLTKDWREVLEQLPPANCSEFPNNSDTISRQAAINKILGQPPEPHYPSWYAEQIKELPPAQPEIIYCKDCVKHNKGLGNYEVHPDGSTTWIWKDSACPLVSWRSKAQGHEFDYQFCAYAEKRER